MMVSNDIQYAHDFGLSQRCLKRVVWHLWKQRPNFRCKKWCGRWDWSSANIIQFSKKKPRCPKFWVLVLLLNGAKWTAKKSKKKMADPSGLHPTAEEICCPLQADVQGSWRCWATHGWLGIRYKWSLNGKNMNNFGCSIAMFDYRRVGQKMMRNPWSVGNSCTFHCEIRRSIKGCRCWSHSTAGAKIHFQVGVSTWLPSGNLT